VSDDEPVAIKAPEHIMEALFSNAI